jgi:hypothetical protein
VNRNPRTIAKRAVGPMLGLFDRRFRELAERLERHTTNLAADHREQLRQVDDKLALDVRLIDEHLLAVQRATRRVEAIAHPLPPELVAMLVAGDDSLLAFVAGPGHPLPSIPADHDVVTRLAYATDELGNWVAAPSENPATLRVLQLRRRA